MSSSDTTVIQGFHGPPTTWTLKAVQEHLQHAVEVEMCTIPLYLYAMYSIKGNHPAKRQILEVVKQEMLHLTLVGNLLLAIGGQPKLYGPKIVPEFPTKLFHENIPLDLQRASKEQFEIFMKIEHPEPSTQPQPHTEPYLADYDSIGAFYKHTRLGLAIISGKENIFTVEAERQLTSFPGFSSTNGLKPVTNLQTANTALDVVIEQGEGNPHGSIPGGQESHYQVFQELDSGNMLDCYGFMKNPKTKDCQRHPFYQAMLACDAVYCYLLLSIEKYWKCDDGRKRKDLIDKNITSLMSDGLHNMAEFMVEKNNAAYPATGPPFNYYPFRSHQSALGEVKELMDAAVKACPDLGSVPHWVATLVDVGNL